MKILYYAQIYSHLSYCVVLWGSMLTTEQKNKLRSLQNKCVKLIDLTKSMEDTYKKHKILTLEQLVDLEQKKLCYNFNHNHLPLNLEKLMLTNCRGKSLKKQHAYNTRLKKYPNLPTHKSKVYNNSFLVQSLKNYNALEHPTKNCTSLKKFISLVKEAAIMSYNVG